MELRITTARIGTLRHFACGVGCWSWKFDMTAREEDSWEKLLGRWCWMMMKKEAGKASLKYGDWGAYRLNKYHFCKMKAATSGQASFFQIQKGRCSPRLAIDCLLLCSWGVWPGPASQQRYVRGRSSKGLGLVEWWGACLLSIALHPLWGRFWFTQWDASSWPSSNIAFSIVQGLTLGHVSWDWTRIPLFLQIELQLLWSLHFTYAVTENGVRKNPSLLSKQNYRHPSVFLQHEFDPLSDLRIFEEIQGL